MRKITKRQREVLDFLRSFHDTDGRMPTGSEIAAHFGFRDPSSAYQHLEALEAKGRITIRRYGQGRPMAIRITGV